MRNMKKAAAHAAVVLSLVSGAVNADFIVTNADGGLYSVNGETLVATQIAQLSEALSYNEILYMGNNELLMNITGQLIQYNTSTGNQEVVFDIRDYIPTPGIHYTMGLAETWGGDVFFSIESHTQSGTESYGATYNMDTQVFTRLADIDLATGLYFDHHQIGENLFTGAMYSSQETRVFNTLTGQTEAVFDMGFGVVSYLEYNGSLLAMDVDGALYNFDASTGSTVFYGQITGADGSLIGATIPAPAGITALGMLGVLASRRRR